MIGKEIQGSKHFRWPYVSLKMKMTTLQWMQNKRMDLRCQNNQALNHKRKSIRLIRAQRILKHYSGEYSVHIAHSEFLHRALEQAKRHLTILTARIDNSKDKPIAYRWRIISDRLRPDNCNTMHIHPYLSRITTRLHMFHITQPTTHPCTVQTKQIRDAHHRSSQVYRLHPSYIREVSPGE